MVPTKMLKLAKITKQQYFLSSASIVLSILTSSEGAFISSTKTPLSLYSNSPAQLSFSNFKGIVRLHSTKGMASDKDVMQENIVIPSDDIRLLNFEDHSHGSVKILIDQDDIMSDDYKKDFRIRLEATIEACRNLHKPALWIAVPMIHASLIESMAQIEGLEFHHASGKIANLCIWLKDDVENKIPEYATHQVGVGAMVVNSRNEILCVRELRNNYRPWKLPGGLAELGEQLDEAAIREVKEETGIDCRFKSVLSFRHTHGVQFGRSDLYFICRLEPIEVNRSSANEVDIPEPVAQSGEIAATAWVPLEDYRAMVNGENPHPMMQRALELFDGKHDIHQTIVSSIVPGRKPSPIYHTPVGGSSKS